MVSFHIVFFICRLKKHAPAIIFISCNSKCNQLSPGNSFISKIILSIIKPGVMTNDSPIEIAISKKKLIKLLIFAILFMAGGLWMLTAQPQTGNPVFNNPIIKNGAAVLGVLMGIFGTYYFIKKMNDKRPGL